MFSHFTHFSFIYSTLVSDFVDSIEETRFIFVVYATSVYAGEEDVFILEKNKVCSTRKDDLLKGKKRVIQKSS